MVIILNNENFGHGDEMLGKKLMGAFLRKLWMKETLPETIVCYNSGVKLMVQGSDVLDALTGLSEKGVEILGCGTCLDYYHVADDIKVGRRSDMVEISDVIVNAEKVVTV